MGKKPHSLRATILRTIIIPTGAVMLILLAVILLAAHLIQHEIISRQRIVIGALAQQGNQYLQETDRLMRTLAPTIADAPAAEQRALLARVRADYPRFTALYLLDENGYVLAEDAAAFTLLGLDMSGEQFFHRAHQPRQIYFSPPFISLATGQVAITGAVPIFSDTDFQGMLVGELSLALLQQAIEQVDVGEQSVSFIVAPRGALIAHPNHAWVQERRDFSTHDLVQKRAGDAATLKIFFDAAQDAWLIGSATVMTQGWIVATAQPAVIIAQPLIMLTVAAGLAFGVSLLLFIWGQVYSLQQITTPIAALVQWADTLASGQYDSQPAATMSNFSEIASLSHSFTQMAHAIAERAAALVIANQSLENELQERVRTEELLRVSEERFRRMADNMREGLTIIEQGEIIYANARACEIWGCSAEEFRHMSGLNAVAPEERARLQRIRAEIAQTGAIPETLEYWIVRGDGSRRYIQNRYSAQTPSSYSVLTSDITERKLALDGLRRARREWEEIFQAIGHPTLILDPQHRIIAANRAAAIAAGMTADELTGQLCCEVFHGSAQYPVCCPLENMLLSAHLETAEMEMDALNGTFLVSCTPMFDDQGNLDKVIHIATDVTEHRRAEEEIHRLNQELELRVQQRTAQLEAANKELEAFSYSVSHDLRAPLRAVEGFSHILLEDFAAQLPDEARHYLQLVQNNARQMKQLIDDLLNFSRLSRQPLCTREIAPAALVHQVLQELPFEQEARRVDISIGDLPPCQADPALLKQVFVNLLSNALKFTRGRAAATIEIGCQQEEARRVYFVKDNGAGFDMRYADRLFGVFQRLHRADEYEGTGVGLAIVQRIIHRHGGQIWAEAEVDKGATFYFTLGARELDAVGQVAIPTGCVGDYSA